MKESNGSQYISNTQLQKMTVKTYNTIFEIIHCQQPHIISPFISITITSHSKEGVCYDTWTSPDGQYRNQIDYILCSEKWRNYTASRTRQGAACGSDREFLIAKFRLKLKKVGKTTRPFRYDLNHIPYDYTVEVRNRFKGLDMIERCLMNYGWGFVTLYRRQGARPSPKKEIKKAMQMQKQMQKKKKWLSEEALQIPVKSSEKQRRKGKIYPFECRVPKNSKKR